MGTVWQGGVPGDAQVLGTVLVPSETRGTWPGLCYVPLGSHKQPPQPRTPVNTFPSKLLPRPRRLPCLEGAPRVALPPVSSWPGCQGLVPSHPLALSLLPLQASFSATSSKASLGALHQEGFPAPSPRPSASQGLFEGCVSPHPVLYVLIFLIHSFNNWYQRLAQILAPS